ncbi:MAG: hypothetical protein L0I62_07845 [Gammaproteobacteria bacterium]|nr:hypothetical protein [Gammaproteobacteria bacterium]
MRPSGKQQSRHRFPPTRTSPWFFIVLMVMTVVFILGGIFEHEGIINVVSWLAVVL